MSTVLEKIKNIIMFPDNLLQNYNDKISNDYKKLYKQIIKGQCKNLISENPFRKLKLYIVLLTIGLHYGFESNEYLNIYNNIFKYSIVDYNWLITEIKAIFKSLITNLTYITTFSNKLDITYIKNNYTILLLSDWGTGSIRSINTLKEAIRVTNNSINMVIHGGDTYYSGNLSEQKANLYNPLKKYLPANCIIRAIRGNHDTYSGSIGYNWLTNKIGQNASYFGISHDKFIIQGLDTSYQDKYTFNNIATNLTDQEAKWHIQHIILAKKSNKKVILFSHHQPVTLHTINSKNNIPVNESLCAQFMDVMDSIDTWYFGHKHNFILYQDYKFPNKHILKKPRQIGHGCTIIRPLTFDNLYTPSSFNKSIYQVPKILSKSNTNNDWKLSNNNYVIDSGFSLLKCTNNKVFIEHYTIHSKYINEYEPAKLVHIDYL